MSEQEDIETPCLEFGTEKTQRWHHYRLTITRQEGNILSSLFSNKLDTLKKGTIPLKH